MTIPHRIGSYLSRDVHCGAVEGGGDFEGIVMGQSLVLINTAEARLSGEEQAHLTDQIVRLRPLGVFFTGPAAEMMFDRLLQALDTPNSPLPIMTNFSSAALPEAVEEFLSSTWPADGYWEQWREYLLLSIDGSVRQLEEAAKYSIDG
jgi:hypothetical protein